ncbi:MAG: NADH-quinone oxidoreductase subunit L [Actinomycetota bacterium]|jgi:NADH-quinone oxidoreductase subunit L|nr:NADH-quinone oxidoreductase subunit L [Actinomycetota bacterium]
MEWFIENAWLAVALPFLMAVPTWLLGQRAKWLAPVLAATGPLLLCLVGFTAIATHGDGSHAGASVSWIPGTIDISAGWMIDGLTAIMFAVVGVVALMVVVFSIGYMHGDKGWARYFMLLSLFTGSMSLLVAADSLLILFVGWELVGACSYLLIGFWFEKPSAAAAAVKAFLVTRIGDAGLLLGLALLWREVGSFRFADIFDAVAAMPGGTLTAVALLLFMGAAGKSAQFPLHIWLPDAMEGPTPVSALIHAATMVAAGVFLIARMWPVFEASQAALVVILAIGALTALASASIALVQRDIKKVLAYSTISQLGFMFAALGAGAWGIAMFHLVTHAAFKALLFLGSGSVIHGSGTQDMHKMGGLRRVMPITAATWILGAGALAGVPPLAGFFSKDEVLHAVWGASPVAGIALGLASLMTAFYITRATCLTFFGKYRGDGHPHESDYTMTVPLMVLGIGALGLGFTGHLVAEVLGTHAESLDPVTAVLSTMIALVGIGAAWWIYREDVTADQLLQTRAGRLWDAASGGYGADTVADRMVVRPVMVGARALYERFERTIVDGAVEGFGRGVSVVGRTLASLQNGDGQWYGAMLGASVVIMLAIVWSYDAINLWAVEVISWIGG